MTALSLAPVGAVAQAGEYLRHGDIDNVEQLLRFLADTFLLEGYGFAPPREVARPRRLPPRESAMCRSRRRSKVTTRSSDGRRVLLPLAPADRQHGVRRRAVRGHRGRRRQRRGRLELHVAARRRRPRPGARAARGQRRRAVRDDAGDGRLERGRRGRGRGRRRRGGGLAGMGRLGARRPGRARDPGRLRDRLARLLAGVRLRPRAAGRRDAGRDSRVRRALAGRRDLVQGARRRRLARRRARAPLRARPRALLEGCAAGRAHRPAAARCRPSAAASLCC